MAVSGSLIVNSVQGVFSLIILAFAAYLYNLVKTSESRKDEDRGHIAKMTQRVLANNENIKKMQQSCLADDALLDLQDALETEERRTEELADHTNKLRDLLNNVISTLRQDESSGPRTELPKFEFSNDSSHHRNMSRGSSGRRGHDVSRGRRPSRPERSRRYEDDDDDEPPRASGRMPPRPRRRSPDFEEESDRGSSVRVRYGRGRDRDY